MKPPASPGARQFFSHMRVWRPTRKCSRRGSASQSMTKPASWRVPSFRRTARMPSPSTSACSTVPSTCTTPRSFAVSRGRRASSTGAKPSVPSCQPTKRMPFLSVASADANSADSWRADDGQSGRQVAEETGADFEVGVQVHEAGQRRHAGVRMLLLGEHLRRRRRDDREIGPEMLGPRAYVAQQRQLPAQRGDQVAVVEVVVTIVVTAGHSKKKHPAGCLSSSATSHASLPWQALNFLPLPHGHGSLRPTFTPM